MQPSPIEATKRYRESPPFLLGDGLSYDEPTLRKIFLETNPDQARRCSSNIVMSYDIEYNRNYDFIELATEQKQKIDKILLMLNYPKLREIELEIIRLKNESLKAFKDFASIYEHRSIRRRKELNKTLQEFREFFGGIIYKKVLSPSEASKLIWPTWNTTPCQYIYYSPEGEFHFDYLNESFRNELEKEQNRKNKAQELLSDYIKNSAPIPSLQEILYTPVCLSDGKIKYVSYSTYALVKPIIEEKEKRLALDKKMKEALLLNQKIEKERKFAEENERKRILELFNKNNSFANIEIGGDTYLYYIRIKYKNRKKFCYKIGITIKPDLRMRFPGKNYRNIDKILFFEKVVNAPIIEAQILRLFEEHAFPVNIFEDYGGHTEIFDHDVLRLDDGS
jgi:hypothetical protein